MSVPILIAESTPIEAWRAACRALIAARGHRLSNLVVHIDEPGIEDPAASRAVDRGMEFIGSHTSNRVAATICPRAVLSGDWEANAKRLLPRLGTRSYFRRMIDFDGTGTINQIAEVVRAQKRAYVDPGPIILERPGGRAHIGFPCLSAVQFHRDDGCMETTAIYRSHFYHDKAYGNFLGLSRLATLVARESELKLGGLTVVSTSARLDEIRRISRLVN